VLIKTIYLLLICASHIAESRSNPDETRLRNHLFDPASQKIDDLTTTPHANSSEIIYVDVAMWIVKLIDLVKTKSFFALR